MHLRLSALILGVFAIAASSVQAADEFVTRRKIEPTRIAELKPVLAEEMAPGGRFESVSVKERARINEALDEMVEAVQGNGSLDDLDAAERVAVYNLQEEINAILLKR